MITHITVEDAAKLISWASNMNKTAALIYIGEAADRGGNTGRNFVGIELNRDYFEIAKNRIEDANKAMTDEAVEMVMERMEALKDGKDI